MLKEDLKDVLAECYLNTKACASVIFPDRFYLPFSSIHDEIFKPLDDDSIQKVCIAAPRGFGKSSIVNLAYPAKKILFRDKKFIVPISNTATQATMQGENLKNELLSNPIVKELFGNMKSNTFSKEQWITDNGVMVMPRGAGQQVRGFLYGNYRPDLIIIDDLEDAESVRSEEQRKKLKEWFFADVMNSVSRSSKSWKIVVIGTLLHEDSLLANLLEDKTWYTVKLEICDDQYKSNWPDFMSDNDIAQLVDSFRVQGMLDTFYREYRNIAISTEDATFLQQYFRYYDETETNLDKNNEIENVVIIDPAKTVKMHSAHSAIVGIGVDLIHNKFYIRDVIGDMLHPDELYTKAINMCKSLKARVLAVEVTSLNEFITYPLKTAIAQSGIVLTLVELSARAKKEDRISALVPFYRRGLIYHNKSCCGALEAQLLSFPRGRRVDIIDAEAYLIELLEEGERYFMPEGVAKLESEAFNKLNESDDFSELENDDFGEGVVERGRWRAI